MTTIYLIRHGQKEVHAGDPGLTKLGINQATQTGHYLKDHPITQIIASPFKRTIETAQHIGKVLNLEYTLDEKLIERMNWEDKNITRNEFLREWIKATNDREYIPKYGDSSRATGQRIERLVDDLTKDDSHIILVTHGGAIIDYLRNIFGDEKLSDLRKKYDEGEDFQMLNCSVNKVVLKDNPILELLNYSDHLESESE
ncbi:MAG: histidine phosphatase family protein [Candidatus Pacebacteria bacterium]|nr:histidine phosphatase family protein [Candidatus Paceibacterota bacterium]